jgi:hypothetical protein
MATEVNLYIDQGAEFYHDFLIAGEYGYAEDITGWTVKSQMRKYYGSSFGYTFESGVIEPGENGMIYISMTNEQTRDIPAGRYLYDVEATDLSGKRYRIAEGIVEVTPEITKI